MFLHFRQRFEQQSEKRERKGRFPVDPPGRGLTKATASRWLRRSLPDRHPNLNAEHELCFRGCARASGRTVSSTARMVPCVYFKSIVPLFLSSSFPRPWTRNNRYWQLVKLYQVGTFTFPPQPKTRPTPIPACESNNRIYHKNLGVAHPPPL